MNQEQSNFYRPGELVIVVRELTKEIITEAIEAYAENDAFWLKLHQFAGDIDISVLNQLQAQHIEQSTKFELLCGLDDLKYDINKLEKLDNLEKSKLVDSLNKLSKLYED